MIENMWGFKDINELNKDVSNYPETILKEQIRLLGEQTEFILRGKTLCMKVSNPNIGYEMATVFDLVVPALDNYCKTLLILYSNYDDIYPVAITVGKAYNDDMESFTPSYNCQNQDEYMKSLKNVLRSNEVMEMIKTLYSKANMMSNIY